MQRGLRHVITFADLPAGADMTLAALETSGAPVDTDARRTAYRTRALAVRPDDVATIIYTSGTTGEPKGVMLTHDNIYSNVMVGKAAIPFVGDDTCLSFLPLSHIFERDGRPLHDARHGDEHRVRRVGGHGAAQHDRRCGRRLVLSVPRLIREDVRARARERRCRVARSKRRIFSGRGVADRWAGRAAGRSDAAGRARPAIQDRAAVGVL